ncbi:HEPN domain-containing protein [Methylocystis echinoides]|uniref:HEPN domain-containing protein n=1 Tax=Methylocystis echinoides TaxID=29468 RepID=UPI00341F5514
MSAEAQRRRRIASFLSLAEEEFGAAGMLLARLPRQAAYFQQQCVEKLLRAVLEAEGVPVGPTHNIRQLADMLPPDHVLKARFLEFETLVPRQRGFVIRPPRARLHPHRAATRAGARNTLNG